MATSDVSGRLARIESVFSAIAEAWSGAPGTPPGTPPGPPSPGTPPGGSPLPPKPGGGGGLPQRSESRYGSSYGGSSGGVDTQTPFIRKMKDFAATLDPAEQDQLAVLLAAATAASKQAVRAPQNEQQRNAADFLQQLDIKLAAGASTAGAPGAPQEATPTITLTTTATVAASHPWIGC